ncbi:polyketide cyclase SnoaL-like domain-containing protein [Tanacetum coccineum]
MFGVKRNRHQKHRRLLPLCAPRGSDHEDSKAIETVFRLYEAIKHKNLNEMSEIIGHDCFCVCSFISMFKTFSGKKQVMEFFSALMANLGNKFEFVVQPTLHDGMMVGVSWKLVAKFVVIFSKSDGNIPLYFSNGVVGDTTHDQQAYNGNSSSSMRSSMVKRKSKHTEIDVCITDDEVTIKLIYEGSSVNATTIANKLIEVVDKQYTAISVTSSY